MSKEQQTQQIALRDIESKLIYAHEQFVARRYQSAISAYEEASDLISALLIPTFPVGASKWLKDKMLHSALFDSMLSAGIEWMNILPIRQPDITSRPRIVANSSLLGDSSQYTSIGVNSGLLMSGDAMNALADWQLAQNYLAQGNIPQANVFNLRAKQTSPDVIQLLESNDVNKNSINLPTSLTNNQRSFGTFINGELVQFEWKAGEAPPIEKIKKRVYEQRVNVSSLKDLLINVISPSDIALNLPHYYYYVIPLSLAECHHALGSFAEAESLYFRCTSYQYLNPEIEAPFIWQRLANLYLEWGNFLYRQDQVADALDIYGRLLTPDRTAPTSNLYSIVSLQPATTIGITVISKLDLYIAHTHDETVVLPDLNPLIVAPILAVYQQLLKIAAGLDYWGVWHPSVPIWTFDYLQSVAINFTQLAIGAERDFINFQSHADESALTRLQLQQSAIQANAEVEASKLAADAARAEISVYENAANLANERSLNARLNADQYSSMSADQIVRQAVAAQLSGGDDGNHEQLNQLADTMMGKGPVAEYMREHPGNWRFEGSAATLSAAEQLVAARLNQQYEVDALNRQANEMALANSQAQSELVVAQARAAAADAGTAVAEARLEAANQSVIAFDNQFFTPEVWYRMGQEMLHLYHRYFSMALRAARLMQQAYNFETDQNLHWIKGDYTVNEIKGLLGADMLMADIQHFTYNLITSTTSKPQPIKQTISLAERYGFQFENQFRKTGIMEFETRVDDFDLIYPGTYAGRIDSVEVEILGIVPAVGISGTLTNSGISAYRTPSSSQLNPNANGLKYRLQPRETLVLSDYFVRQDALLVTNDNRMTKIFQGAGVISTWKLEIPKAINDLDYGALTDVRITFYYKARYDPALQQQVINQLASRPGVNGRQRGIPLRWIYPDAFFGFQETGELRFSLNSSDFRHNEKNPMLTDIGIIVITDDTALSSGLNVALSTPVHLAPIMTATNAQGAIPAGNMMWSPLIGGSAIGEYTITLSPENNPSLAGPDKFSHIINIAVIIGYSFTPSR